MMRRSVAPLLPAIAVLALATPAEADFHLWQIKEVYSNADGSVQYIELFTTFPGQSVLANHTIVATSDGVPRTFTFVGNLPSSDTANRHLLIATPGFAALPGAVTPDYILPCGPFFDPVASSTTIDFQGADVVVFAGASLPTDGTNSLTDTTLYGPTTFVSGPSSPTNFSGTVGAMALTGCLQLGTCEPCDDSLFCNGVESCSASACVAGIPPCDDICDENQDICIPDPVVGLGYSTVAPCRVIDTRGGAPIGGPVLQGQQTRTFAVAGNCGVPATARAISINLAVTQPTATGNARLFPGGQPVPTISSINYAVGQTRGNNAIIPLNGSGEMAAFVGQPAGSTVHLIIDVNGYFE